eukprot:gene3946-4569_t
MAVALLLATVATTASAVYPAVTVDKTIFSTASPSVYVLDISGAFSLVSQSNPNYTVSATNMVVDATYSDEIETLVDDVNQAYFAGFSEGAITAPRIYQMYTNFAQNEFANSTPSANLVAYMNAQMNWVRKGVNARHDQPTELLEASPVNSTVYWHAAALVMAQFDGLVAGYAASTSPALTQIELYLLTSAGDLETLNTLYGKPTSTASGLNRHKMTDEDEDDTMPDNIDYLDCSALLRVLPNNQDVYSAHTTWRYYYAMLRIYKYYNFAFQHYGLASSVSFSSSPGFLSSKDDFYLTGHGLAVMETTNVLSFQNLSLSGNVL